MSQITMDRMISEYAMVHPMAHVADSNICSGARIWQFASVIRGAVIGIGTQVAHGALVDGAHVGDGCLIGANAAIHPGVVIEDHVFVGPGVTFCNDAWPRTDKAGFQLFIPAFAMHYEIRRKEATIVVEKGASIGANATILPGIVIGEGAMIAAGATVQQSVGKDYMLHRDGRCVEISADREKTGRAYRVRKALCRDDTV